MDFTYYADLNPRYGARYERRYAVFLRKSATETAQTNLHYTTLKAAENAARRLIEQEADHEVTNHPNRSQRGKIRLSLTPDELQALADLVLFAKNQGYHPMTAYAQAHDPNNGTLSLIVKVYATMRAVLS